MWDLIHDRTHMRGDLPFDPFMIKQRMPYFLYSLEELRCDLTAYRECVRIAADTTPIRRPATTRRWSSRRSSSTGSSASRSPAPGCATTTALGGSCSSPGCTSTGCCTGRTAGCPSTGPRLPTSWSRSGRDRRTVLALHRPAQAGPLAGRLRAGLRHLHPPSGLGLGARQGRAAAGRSAARAHRPGPGRRVPAVDVLRGAGEEDAPGDRVHRRDHRRVRSGAGLESPLTDGHRAGGRGPSWSPGPSASGVGTGRRRGTTPARPSGGRHRRRATASSPTGATSRTWPTRPLRRPSRRAARPAGRLVHLVGGWRGGRGLAGQSDADWEFLHRNIVATLRNTTRAFHEDLAASARAGSRSSPPPRSTPPPPPRPTTPRPRRPRRPGPGPWPPPSARPRARAGTRRSGRRRLGRQGPGGRRHARRRTRNARSPGTPTSRTWRPPSWASSARPAPELNGPAPPAGP